MTNNSVNWKNRAKRDLNWDFTKYREECTKQGINFDQIWDSVKDAVIKTIITAESHITAAVEEHPNARKACFEMLGFDIMIDDQLKAWVIECNDWPNNFMIDETTKRVATNRVCDELTLLGIQPYDKVKVQSASKEETKLRPF